jgi:transposase
MPGNSLEDTMARKTQGAALASYAPELNPVEYIWAWMKKHALANYRSDTFGELSTMAKSKLQSVKRRKTLILAFWKQAELPGSDPTYSGNSVHRPLRARPN